MWSESHEHANYTNWAHREHSGTGEDYGDCDAFSNVWEDAQQVNLEHSKVGMITIVYCLLYHLLNQQRILQILLDNFYLFNHLLIQQ